MPFTDPFARRVVPLVDLTRLGLPCQEDDVRALCERAKRFGVAAVCVWPDFAELAKAELAGTSVRVSSLLTLESGPSSFSGEAVSTDDQPASSEWMESDGLSCAFYDRAEAGATGAGEAKEAGAGVAAGAAAGGGSIAGEACGGDRPRADFVPEAADEVEFMFPWAAFVNGERAEVERELAQVRGICGEGRLLKVTMETGLYPSLDVLRAACHLSIEAGADFITTSTGKRERGATLEAVRVLCAASRSVAKHVGVKISGGVRDQEDAQVYIDLVSELMGLGWVEAGRFRLGTSHLLDALEESLY